METQLQTYKTETGNKTVLVGEPGRKLLPILIMEAKGLTVKKVPLDEQRFLRDPVQAKKVPAMTTLIKRFRAFGNRVGTTKAAKRFLADAARS